jgi:hypothetical protein
MGNTFTKCPRIEPSHIANAILGRGITSEQPSANGRELAKGEVVGREHSVAGGDVPVSSSNLGSPGEANV